MDSVDGIEIDWSMCKPSESDSISKDSDQAGVISVINSAKGNGRRIHFSFDLMVKIKKPEKVQFTFYEKTLIIGEKIPNCTKSYTVKKDGKKGIVYAANLVKEITDVFGLDFSDGRVCRTFHDVEYFETDDCTVAVIEMQS